MLWENRRFMNYTYIHIHMAIKTISITEDAYNSLKSKKDPNESFSEIIVRLSGKKSLSSFFGALSKESADALEDSINEARKKHRLMHQKRVQK